MYVGGVLSQSGYADSYCSCSASVVVGYFRDVYHTFFPDDGIVLVFDVGVSDGQRPICFLGLDRQLSSS